MTSSSVLYIGIKGAVLALDRATGAEVWISELKGSDFVNVAIVDGDVYAATKGELFCLDAATGATRWHNPLRGYGWGLISIATAGGQTVLLREKQRQDEDAAAAATTTAST
jgi:outer membrane protein assembly factor BamB